MSNIPPVGTIVRLIGYPKGVLPDPLAVVLPRDRWPEQFGHEYAFTRLLTDTSDPQGFEKNGWWIGPDEEDGQEFEIIPEESVPDDIAALATRVLLDPDFIPFKEQT